MHSTTHSCWNTKTVCCKTISVLHTMGKQHNCGLIAPQRFPQLLLNQIKQLSTWIKSAEFKSGTAAAWRAEVQLDSVGGTEPVISKAMFNLQWDQSRGTPRKRIHLERSAAQTFCFVFQVEVQRDRKWRGSCDEANRESRWWKCCVKRRRTRHCCKNHSLSHETLVCLFGTDPNSLKKPVCYPRNLTDFWQGGSIR